MYETIERPLIPVLLGDGTAGIKVDGKELKRLQRRFRQAHGRRSRLEICTSWPA